MRLKVGGRDRVGRSGLGVGQPHWKGIIPLAHFPPEGVSCPGVLMKKSGAWGPQSALLLGSELWVTAQHHRRRSWEDQQLEPCSPEAEPLQNRGCP